MEAKALLSIMCVSPDFFILNGVSLVKSILFKCVGCRRLRAKQCSQKMSDLPFDRVSRSDPFENVGCDFLALFKSKFVVLLSNIMDVYLLVFILELSILRCVLICHRILSFSLYVDLSLFVAQFRVFDVIRVQILLVLQMS